MGTMTINTTVGEDTRLQVAFGKILGLGRDATGPEVKAGVLALIKNAVQNQEQLVASAAAIAGVSPIAPT